MKKGSVKIKWMGFLNVIKTLSMIVFALCSILLVINFVYSNKLNKEIHSYLKEFINDVKQRTNATHIDIEIFADPREEFIFIPSDSTAQILLTVHCDNLRSKTKVDWAKILLNRLAPSLYYGQPNSSYAVYSKTANVFNKEHPVFITATDGLYSYSLYSHDIKYNEPNIVKANIKEELRLSKISYTSKILCVVITISATLSLLCFSFVRKIRLKYKVSGLKFYLDCITRGIDINNTPQAEILEFAKPYADACKISNIVECYKYFYDCGKTLYEQEANRTEKKNNNINDFSFSTPTHIDAETLIKRISKRNRKRNLVIILIPIILLFAIVASYLLTRAKNSPSNIYSEAIRLKDAGMEDEAYKLFKELGDYEDCKTICEQYDYRNALSNLSNGKYAKAYQILSSLNENANAKNKATELLAERPYLSVLDSNIGDVIKLGEYDQGNGYEPIEWSVIAKEHGNVLLISKDILDAKQFNTEDMLDCSLDKWLVDEFRSDAFSNINENIIDVYLIDESILEDYGTGLLRTSPTKYAKEQYDQAEIKNDEYYYWIAGSVFSSYGKAVSTVYCGNDMILINDCPVISIRGVRPIIWVCPNGPESFPAKYKYSGDSPSEAEIWKEYTYIDRIQCTWCGGDGRTHDWVDIGQKCWHCNGTGWIEIEKTGGSFEKVQS